MWFKSSAALPDWSTATDHLRSVDPIMAGVMDRVGPCTLRPRRDPFVVLCSAIFSQQLSVAAAATLFNRFRDQFPRRRPTPPATIKFLTRTDTDLIKQCGISRQKQKYLLDLAQHFADGRLQTTRLSKWSDDQVIDHLTQVNGIGRWTAEMFLIFTLNRTDVLPLDDLGLLKGVQRAFDLPLLATKKQAEDLAECWRPYRTIGTWYLWRMLTPRAE